MDAESVHQSWIGVPSNRHTDWRATGFTGAMANLRQDKFGGARLLNELAPIEKVRIDCYCRSTQALETRQPLVCDVPRQSRTVNALGCNLYRLQGKPGPINVAIRTSCWVMATSGVAARRLFRPWSASDINQSVSLLTMWVVREPRPPTKFVAADAAPAFAICYLLFVMPAEPQARPASLPLDAGYDGRGRSPGGW